MGFEKVENTFIQIVIIVYSEVYLNMTEDLLSIYGCQPHEIRRQFKCPNRPKPARLRVFYSV